MRTLRWLRLAGILLVLLVPGRARVVTVRRFFEPTDMEFEEPGALQLDTPWGLVRGEDAFRISVPDFELDVGLPWDLELDALADLLEDGAHEVVHRIAVAVGVRQGDESAPGRGGRAARVTRAPPPSRCGVSVTPTVTALRRPALRCAAARAPRCRRSAYAQPFGWSPAWQLQQKSWLHSDRSPA